MERWSKNITPSSLPNPRRSRQWKLSHTKHRPGPLRSSQCTGMGGVCGGGRRNRGGRRRFPGSRSDATKRMVALRNATRGLSRFDFANLRRPDRVAMQTPHATAERLRTPPGPAQRHGRGVPRIRWTGTAHDVRSGQCLARHDLTPPSPPGCALRPPGS
jgi:hypothetical protein